MISEWSHFKDNFMQKKTFKDVYGTKVNILPTKGRKKKIKNMYGTKMNIWPIKGQNIHFKAQLSYLE